MWIKEDYLMDKELEEAHLDYERRKNEIISKLRTLQSATVNVPTIEWLEQAIKFIEEKEI